MGTKRSAKGGRDYPSPGGKGKKAGATGRDLPGFPAAAVAAYAGEPAGALPPLPMTWRGGELPDEVLDALARLETQFLPPLGESLAAHAAALTEPDRDPMAKVGPENVVGYLVMEKYIGREATGRLGITLLVRRKVSESRVEKAALVPPAVAVAGGRDEVPTDVLEVSQIVARQVNCGSSVSHPRVTFGTIGACVVDADDYRCVLSNNHVLANADHEGGGYARSVATHGVDSADPIVAPGTAHGGRVPDDRIGLLSQYAPIKRTSYNRVDAALAWTKAEYVNARIGTASNGFRVDPEPVAAREGMRVRKIGARTGHTVGRVVGTGRLLSVRYEPRNAFGVAQPYTAPFHGVLAIRGENGPFSDRGDSGSLIVEADTYKPVGLLFAGDDATGFGALTYANPIGWVIDEFGLGDAPFIPKFPDEDD